MQHKGVHENHQIPYKICGKRLKSKKALSIHMLLHGNKKHKCNKCDKTFFQKCNYVKHYKQVHEDRAIYNCSHCPMIFTNKHSFDKHTTCTHHVISSEYFCVLCKKSFYRKYQLKRHVQTSHSSIMYRCPFCHMTARHRHSIRRHFKQHHNNLRQEWDKIGFVTTLAEKVPQFVTSFQQQKTKLGDSIELKDVHIERETIDLRLVSDDIKVSQHEEHKNKLNRRTDNNKNTAIENEQLLIFK